MQIFTCFYHIIMSCTIQFAFNSQCSLKSLLLQFGSLIKEFHAKDGRYPDPNNPYELGAEVPIPTGEVNFPAVIAELKKQGFQGALTIECELNGARHDYVIKTREYLQGLLDN